MESSAVSGGVTCLLYRANVAGTGRNKNELTNFQLASFPDQIVAKNYILKTCVHTSHLATDGRDWEGQPNSQEKLVMNSWRDGFAGVLGPTPVMICIRRMSQTALSVEWQQANGE